MAARHNRAGPGVVYFVEPEGCLVTQFIAGRPITPAEMRRPETIQQAACFLQVIPRLPPIPGLRGVPKSLSITAAWLPPAGQLTIPDNVVDWLFDRALQIENAFALAPLPPCPCHNDILNENFLRETATGDCAC